MRRRGVTQVLTVVCCVAVLFLPGCGKSLAARPGLEDSVRDYSGMLPVFPGAQGYGTSTSAGRGGSVLRVTTLEAAGPGSLRAAVETPGKRTILFEVAGVIELSDVLVVAEPHVTIAGQSAPAPGITLTGAGLVVSTHDVLVQHVRVRVGDRREGPEPGGRDGISVTGRPDGERAVYNVVIDHCSAAWAVDEGMSTWYPGVYDVTFSHCIIAQNLNDSIHPKGPHSKGLLLGDHSRRVSVLGNLFAHNVQRNPLVKGDVSALIVNNLVYNPENGAVHFGDLENSGPSLGGVFGNVLIPGQNTRRELPLIVHHGDGQRSTKIFTFGNDSGGAELFKSARHPDTWFPLVRYEESPIRVVPLTLLPSGEVESRVLAGAGARPLDRDPVDQEIVAQVRERRGVILDSQEEAGGFPRQRPVERLLSLPEPPEADENGDGYTNLEEWLHREAARLEAPRS